MKASLSLLALAASALADNVVPKWNTDKTETTTMTTYTTVSKICDIPMVLTILTVVNRSRLALSPPLRQRKERKCGRALRSYLSST